MNLQVVARRRKRESNFERTDGIKLRFFEAWIRSLKASLNSSNDDDNQGCACLNSFNVTSRTAGLCPYPRSSNLGPILLNERSFMNFLAWFFEPLRLNTEEKN